MSGMITDLGALASGSVDRTADLLEIVDLSANTSYKITVNNLLGITGGSVVSTSDSQSLTNKTLDNTNVITLKASNWTLQDASDTSKQAKWGLSGITTATTRTITLPDASGTLVLTAATQTLTNKTLTSPTITGGTIDNSTITVDSIAGHTSATIVTIANLQVSNGVLNTANAVTATSIADGAIQPKALTSGTGTGWAWSSWTPTWTNVTVGNGTVDAKYIQTGKMVTCRILFTMGSTSAISGQIIFTTPNTIATGPVSFHPLGVANCTDQGVADYLAHFGWQSSTQVQVLPYTANGTYAAAAFASSTVPFTWGTNDKVHGTFTYEAA